MTIDMNKNIVISSSGLNLVKNFIRYIELINILKPYSFEIFIALSQVFELYVFTCTVVH